MKITYDPTVDALYIRFKETTVTTHHVSDSIALDYDAEGYLAGIEVLEATVQFNVPSFFNQIIVEYGGVNGADGADGADSTNVPLSPVGHARDVTDKCHV